LRPGREIACGQERLPIAWALVQSLHLPLPGRGAALILLSTFEMAVLPGCALLTGALWGPYVGGLFATPKLSPLVLVGTILLPLHVFWFNYQNIWIVMTEGISGRQGYTDAHRIRLATVFFVVTIVTLWISAGYRRLIGLV
jgi:hypothetical protein